MSSSKAARSGADLAQRVTRLYEEAQQMLADGAIDRISEQSVQELLTAAVKLYVAKREAGSSFSPFSRDAKTALASCGCDSWPVLFKTSPNFGSPFFM